MQIDNSNNQLLKSSDISLLQKDSTKGKINYSGRNEAYVHNSSKRSSYNKIAYSKSPESLNKLKLNNEKISVTQGVSDNIFDTNQGIKSPKVELINKEANDCIQSTTNNDNNTSVKRKITIIKEPRRCEDIYRKLVFEGTKEQAIHSDIDKIKFKYQNNFRNLQTKTNELRDQSKIIVEESKERNWNVIKESEINYQNKTPRSVVPKQSDWSMSEAEKKVYANRTPKNYIKISILGRGGCALVWLGKNTITDKIVALKQFPKGQSSITSAKIEEQIFKLLNSDVNNEHIGNKSISHLLDIIDDKKDTWLVYEVGGDSLSKVRTYKGKYIGLVQYKRRVL